MYIYVRLYIYIYVYVYIYIYIRCITYANESNIERQKERKKDKAYMNKDRQPETHKGFSQQQNQDYLDF